MAMTALKEIETLSRLRGSEVIVYFTSDKKPAGIFTTQIADDVIPLFNEQLNNIAAKKKPKKISLFLYSSGGFLTTPWPLVNLIREYCEELEVIIPFKALSAATLISLGADKIVMTPLSQLSPIDPSGQFQTDDKKGVQTVQVEDITSFFDFAKNKVGIKTSAGLTEALKELTKHIAPPIVGSVNRTHSLIRMLAEKMLSLHVKSLSKTQIEKIIKPLTETLFSHQHYINRREARDYIGLANIVEYADPETETAINDLFAKYAKEFKLGEEFDAISLVGEKDDAKFKLIRAAVHSKSMQHSLISEYSLKKTANEAGESGIKIAPPSTSWAVNKN